MKRRTRTIVEIVALAGVAVGLYLSVGLGFAILVPSVIILAAAIRGGVVSGD